MVIQPKQGKFRGAEKVQLRGTFPWEDQGGGGGWGVWGGGGGGGGLGGGGGVGGGWSILRFPSSAFWGPSQRDAGVLVGGTPWPDHTSL